MALSKKYSKDKKVCRISFTLPKEICENFAEVSIVGDFNNWDMHQNKFVNKSSDGSSSIELVVDAGKKFQFRYLCDGQIWLNEPEADGETLTHFGDAKNSILIT
jgi:1,4-alpha-glucan branching enzyme